MRYPIALGFTIYAALALYTWVRGIWWRLRRRKRLTWARLYIEGMAAYVRHPEWSAYGPWRAGFVWMRLFASIGWPSMVASAMWRRVVKLYRLGRLVRFRRSHA
jgi:hypothetical protein